MMEFGIELRVRSVVGHSKSEISFEEIEFLTEFPDSTA